METNTTPSVSKENQLITGSAESCSKDLMGSEELEVQEKEKQSDAGSSSGYCSVGQQELTFLRNQDSEECQAGGLLALEPHAPEGEEGLKKTEAEDLGNPRQQSKSAPDAPPEKGRRFTLDRLKQLGVDVSIKPRLGANEDSFVILEEPEKNRGNPLNCREYS